MTDDQIRQLELLLEVLEKWGASTKDAQKVQDAYKRSQEEGKKAVSDLMDKLREGAKTFEEAIKNIDNELKTLTKSQQDQNRKKQLEEEKSQLVRGRAYTKFKADVEAFGQTIYTNGVKRVGDFGKELLNGTDDFRMMADNLKAVVNIVSSFGATIFNTIGSLTKFAPGYGKLVGKVSDVLGGSFEAAGKVINYGIDLISDELQRTVVAFKQATSVGAAFTGGLTQMREAATANFLTLKEFGEVLKNQASNIALAGLGFEEASRRSAGVSDVFAQGADPVRKQLLRLGFSFQEQSELIFETMADMRRGGLLQRASDVQIAEQTQKYAENLRIISAITGEDARKRMQEARTASMNMAIQQRLLEMQKENPEAVQKLNNMLALMPEQLRKPFLQMAVLGTTTDQAARITMAQVPALGRAFDDMVATFYDNTINAQEAGVEVAKQRGLINEGFQENVGILGQMGTAMLFSTDSLINETGQFQAAIYDQVAGQNEATIQAIMNSINGQKKASDGMTKDVTDAMTALQKLRIGLQDTLTDAIKPYIKVQQEFTGWMVKTLGLLKGEGERGSRSDTYTSFVEEQDKLSKMDKRNWYEQQLNIDPTEEVKAQQEIVEEKRQQFLSEQRLSRLKADALAKASAEYNKEYYNGDLDWMLRRQQALPEAMKQQAVESAEAKFKWQNETEEGRANQALEAISLARGGVAEGPISGYSATLHGKEAVVPLPDGETIPVTMKSPTGTGDGQAQMLEVLQRQLEELRNQTGLTYDMIKHLEKGNRTSREILASSY